MSDSGNGDLPQLLIVGPGSMELAHQITKSTLRESDGFRFKLETKYYSAELRVIIKELVEDGLDTSGVQAVVMLYTQGCNVNLLAEDIETKLLVCSGCATDIPDGVSDKLVEYGCEIVGLRDTPSGEDHNEKKGLLRVVEALETTMWSGMQVKDKVSQPGASLDVLDNESTPKEDEPESVKETEEDSDELDDFDLMSMLKSIKQVRANTGDLSDDERRKTAADMALKFADLLNIED